VLKIARLNWVARCFAAHGSPSLLAWALLCAACTPAWDWRDMPVDGTALRVALPCKPDVHMRELPLGGRTVRWTLRSCQAEGLTFGLAWADLGDPARVAPALQELTRAAAANLHAGPVLLGPASVPGSTPQALAQRLRVQGRLPDGRGLQQEMVVFAHGTQVFQATVLGPQVQAPLVQPLFDSLRLQTQVPPGAGQ
jgi:hypothetical protein